MTRAEQLIELCNTAYQEAQKNKAAIANDWRIMDQYSVSSKRFKLLLNNLCSLENCSYLELGCFRGGTLMAALYQNKPVSAYAIDNFTYDPRAFYVNPETGEKSNYNPDTWVNVRMSLIDNLERLGLDKSVKLFAGDWLKTPGSFIKNKVNIIHVDIDKDVDKILNFFCPKFDDTAVIVIGNYNETHVREKFHEFIQTNSLKFEIKHSVVNFSHSNADSEGWWNGLGMYVIERKIVSI